MIQLAWPLVALAALAVLWNFLQAYLRGLHSEREVLARGQDLLRGRVDQLQARLQAHDDLHQKAFVAVEGVVEKVKRLDAKVADQPAPKPAHPLQRFR